MPTYDWSVTLVDGSGNAVSSSSAVALSDSLSNPTTTLVGSCNLGYDGTNWGRCILVNGASDARGASASVGLVGHAFNMDFTGTVFARRRMNTSATFLTSTGRTTTQTSADIPTYNTKGIAVILDMTTVGTGSVTVTINGKDDLSGKYYLLLSGAAIITNSTNVYKVYPGITVAANVSASDHLPANIQIVVTANNANSATYSCGYNLLV